MPYDASTYPFDTVVYVTDTIGATSFQGSGVLISPDEVLTASHVVYSEGVGTATDIVVTPGYNLGSSPYGPAQGSYIHYFQIDDAGDSITNEQSQFDYAVIHLSTPFNTAGTMGLESNYGGGSVSVTGYPASAGGSQVDSSQTVTPNPYYTLLDGTALGPGSSGGPVWTETAGEPEVVGIVSSANGTAGYFTAITTSVFNQIESWVSEDEPHVAPSVHVQNVSVAQKASTAASAGITSVANPSGDSITEYGFYDAGGGSGHLTLNGVTQPNNTWVDVATANLSAVQYVGGSSPGADTLNVEVYDATTGTWSAYSSLTATTVAPSTPGLITSSADLTEALYIGYFGRAADPGGDAYWLNVLGNGFSISAAATSFSVQAESTALYPFLANSAAASQAQIVSFIGSVYQDLFNRSPDSGGLSYWENYLSINAGNPQAVGAFLLAVINGALNTSAGLDQTTIANKVAVADYLTHGFATAGINFSSPTSAPYLEAHNAISKVTSDAPTVTAADASINAWIAANGGEPLATALVGVASYEAHGPPHLY